MIEAAEAVLFLDIFEMNRREKEESLQEQVVVECVGKYKGK